MGYTIDVENIKCGGCANRIRNKLLDLELASDIDIDVANGAVRIDGDPAQRVAAVQALANMGYPEVGSIDGIKAAKARAKSFVSCAIGRFDGARDAGEG